VNWNGKKKYFNFNFNYYYYSELLIIKVYFFKKKKERKKKERKIRLHFAKLENNLDGNGNFLLMN